MDCLTQGVIGAAFSQSVAKKKESRQSFVIGFMAGLLADIDVLIRSSTDSLLSIEYHRHFTHSLIFIPIGGLMTALILKPFLKNKISFKRAFILATTGYATHALLDTCTSYGTMLLWPFSHQRIAWSIISVIDPVFTLSILILSLYSFFKHKKTYVLFVFPFIFFYLTAGIYQRSLVKENLYTVAKQRNHKPHRVLIKPTIGNLLLWKSAYEYNGYYYVDALHTGLFSPGRFYPGEKIKKLNIEKKFFQLNKNSLLYKDMKRFSHFSDGYVVIHPKYPHIIADLRYTLLPHKLDFLWGIEVHPRFPNSHAHYTLLPTYTTDKKKLFFKMLWNAKD